MKKSIILLSAAILGASAWAATKSDKRGFSVNSMTEIDYIALEPGGSWFYDWSTNPPGDEGPTFMNHDLEFCPMVWNTNYTVERLEEVYEKYGSHIKYVLGYNEPNFTDQAHLTPAQAAADWPRFQEWALSHNLKIVSPAVNWSSWSQYNDPVKWLEEFFSLLPDKGEKIDYVACHFYVPTAESLMQNVDRLKKFGKPIWVTEYCAASGNISNSTATQMSYMLNTLKALEQDPDVFRYAWFMARTSNKDWNAINLLNSFPNHGTLTNLGYAFTYMWTFPQDYFHNPLEQFRAVDYSAMFGVSVIPLPKDHPLFDDYKICIDDFGNGSKTEYIDWQMEFAESGSYDLDINAAVRTNTAIDIYWNNTLVLANYALETTGGAGNFDNRKVSGVNIPESGKGTLRIAPSRSMQLVSLKMTRTGDVSVEGIENDESISIRVEGNSIIGADAVFTMSGVQVNAENLAPGLYIAKCGTKASRIAVR